MNAAAKKYYPHQRRNYPVMLITLPVEAHQKIAELAAAWRLPKSTVIQHLILAADITQPPKDAA